MKAAELTRSSVTLKSRVRCRKKFLYYFPKGFADQKYIDWERDYKWQAHLAWEKELNRKEYEQLLLKRKFNDIAQTAARIETKTNLLFSFEKMALRDAIRSPAGAQRFAKGLHDYVYGTDNLKNRFERFVESVALLPRRQTRVLTWPLVTVFGFLANPQKFVFLKPRVTKIAAERYEFPFDYRSTPNWTSYQSYLDFAEQVRKDTQDLRPVDFIDLQSFIWVQGSEEYPE